jgi:hypothetical protein
VNAIEAGELLGTCAAFDRRTTGPADALAWFKVLGDLPFADCEQAVIDHYQQNTDWIMPAHIRRRVMAMRARRLEHVLTPEAPRAIRDNPAAWIAYQRRVTAAIGDGPGGQRAIGGPR